MSVKQIFCVFFVIFMNLALCYPLHCQEQGGQDEEDGISYLKNVVRAEGDADALMVLFKMISPTQIDTIMHYADLAMMRGRDQFPDVYSYARFFVLYYCSLKRIENEQVIQRIDQFLFEGALHNDYFALDDLAKKYKADPLLSAYFNKLKNNVKPRETSKEDYDRFLTDVW